VDRLLKLPRKQVGTTRLLGPEMFFVDGRSCALQHLVIFENGIYSMRPDRTNPRIIDAGANIGMATLYLKQLFPSAKIEAFEADPDIVKVLKKNIASFDLHDVTVHHAAASDKAVRAVRLRDWLHDPVDFLKLDVEGAECDIIADCESLLKNVSQIFVEYHSLAAEEQRLPEMLATLRNTGFRIFVQTDYCAPSPLLDPVCDNSMDLRLTIFGTQRARLNSVTSRGASPTL
jgi:precorrin-6B methylase 2